MKDRGIYLSIKPEFVKLILEGKKNYEFRKYLPKKDFKRIYVYETLPIARIKYVINIDKIFKYPKKIDEIGIGNKEFNNGEKKSKYAYKIGKIMSLKKCIKLEELKEKYNFIPPQSYVYSEKYEKLTEYINNNLINM